MKKISKITLENFRAFLGKKEIDFNNSDNKAADFVCIYGKNGFGKTSLFDGFEWFFTGEIYLLEKELRNNVSTYAGTVLKNKYAHDWERAGISVEYSDGKKGHRTVVQKSNSINDYGKGKPSGEYKELINKKQILPHSKIDSFVYANSPESMFDEWGNFWDPEKQQRNFFKAIYRVYKEIDKKTNDCENQLRDILVELSTLNIESKLKDFNLLVSEYNKMVIAGIGKLEPLEYRENEKIDITTVLSGEKYIEPLTKYISNYRYLSEQCEYLEKHYKTYKDYEQYEEEVYYRKKRREAIIKKCNEKKILVEKKEDLISKMDSMIRNRDSLTDLFDEQWFDEYHRYYETKTKCTKIDINIQNCDL
jgi:SMC domain protein